jgi:hypothetical protein
MFVAQGEVKAVLTATPDFVLNSAFDTACEMRILGDVVPNVGDVLMGDGFVTPEHFTVPPKE